MKLKLIHALDGKEALSSQFSILPAVFAVHICCYTLSVACYMRSAVSRTHYGC